MIHFNIYGKLYKFDGHLNYNSSEYFNMFLNIINYLKSIDNNKNICSNILYLESILFYFGYLKKRNDDKYLTLTEWHSLIYRMYEIKDLTTFFGNTKYISNDDFKKNDQDILSLFYRKNLFYILENIFSFCSNSDLLNIVSVCKFWQKISESLIGERLKLVGNIIKRSKQFLLLVGDNESISDIINKFEQGDEDNFIYFNKNSNKKIIYFQHIYSENLNINQLFKKKNLSIKKKIFELNKDVLFVNQFE
jgi:hypothetical protein